MMPTSAAVAARLALLVHFGPKAYRIRDDGQVEVFGEKPGSAHQGWYRLCHIDQAEAHVATLN